MYKRQVNNAIGQANREVDTRFDFKGVDAKFAVTEESEVMVSAEVDFQIRQMLEILRAKLVKRGVDIKSFVEGDVETTGQKASMRVKIQQGIDSEIARKIVKKVKETKIKVQTAIQGDKLRVSGKKRDDLQNVMSVLKESNLGIPLQYNNFRD